MTIWGLTVILRIRYFKLWVMKVLMMADARSVHTRRWAVSLQKEGVDIVLYSLYPSPDSFFSEHGIRLYVFELFGYKKKSGAGARISQILMHRRAVGDLKSVIAREKPDILHAHYATSFGLVAALTGFHPFIISVWGSDVYEFPFQSLINRKSVELVFRRADRVLSTSGVMAVQTRKFTSKSVDITPFGVDTALFVPLDSDHSDTFVVGNVKTLAPKYGIDVLIRAFRIVLDSNPGRKLSLVIIGDGPCRDEYTGLVSDLGMSDKVTFLGKVLNDRLPEYYNSFSVAVSLSDAESFGVVAVEAMSCACPVVVSDAEGFTEVVEDRVTGFIVPKRNPEAAAAAIQRFIDNPALRGTMGKAGRRRVEERYDWHACVLKMIHIYEDVRES